MSAGPTYLSYGGGTQSAALALMSASGELPRLDAVIFADTQGELPETYEYAEYVKGKLEAAEIPFVVVTAGSLYEELMAPERTMHNPTPPAHVLNPDGSNGRIGKYRCSYDFKRRLIQREAKRLCGGRGAWKRATVYQWLGFSADETRRCKPDNECRCGDLFTLHLHGPEGSQTLGTCRAPKCRCETFDRWRLNVYPLIERGWNRGDTIEWFARNGHPTPSRSACYFCPNSSNERWQLLRAKHPELWEKACVLDAHIRFGAPFNARGNQPFAGQMYLHADRVPLSEADIRTKVQVLRDAGVQSLFDDAEIGMACEAEACFT